ncbi:MAG: putative rane transporter protein YjnA [Pseudomonadota bacterium]|jgi:uncharacterized membrane protein YfcA
MEWGFPIAGLLVGIMVGATGVGGGSLMTPLLVLLLGVAPHTAIGTDLLYASLTKVVGVGVHSIDKRVDWQVFRRLALGSLPAALLTLLWLHNSGSSGVHEGTTIFALGFVLVLTSVAMVTMPAMIRRADRSGFTFSSRFTALQPMLTVFSGALLGFFVTLTSIGAGALGAPLLLFLYPKRLTPARLVATDLAHAIPLALLAGIGHILLGNVDFPMLGQLLLGSIPGVWVGAYFGGRLPGAVLRTLIAVVLALVGIKLLA